jgi:hypothetical protein
MSGRQRWLKVSGMVILEHAAGAVLIVLVDLLILTQSRPTRGCVDTCWGAPLALFALSVIAGMVLGVGLVAALIIVTIRERRRVREAPNPTIETDGVLETATTASVFGFLIAIGALTATVVAALLTAQLVSG